jgi:uncharacterized protein YndB with AHSA1/START domain
LHNILLGEEAPMVQGQIEREVVIQAPPERVWAVLTEPAHVDRWFTNAGADIDLRPGGAIRYRWKEHGEFHAVIETLEPPRRFVWRWALVAGQPPRDGNATQVEMTLIPEGAGTRLRVVERGFGDLDLPEIDRAQHLKENTEGWDGGLAAVKAYLEGTAG